MEKTIIKRFQETAEVQSQFIKNSLQTLIEVIQEIAQCFKFGNKVFFFGNGGSAADAQHLAAEFVNRYLRDRPPLPAIALTSDTSILTSISNDTDFSEVFARQLKALGKEGDIAIGITTSGNSPNILKAFRIAKGMGIKTVALTGRDGGAVKKEADFSLVVPSHRTPQIQETHILIGHIICEMVETLLFEKPE
ncbi:MAG: D-sedoheptulose-7-phosphate isomerase [Thermodesulfobacteriota bacterium]